MKFEDGMKRLAEITAQLEAGGLSLEESVALYGEGAKLAADCQKELQEAKIQITAFEQSRSENSL